MRTSNSAMVTLEKALVHVRMKLAKIQLKIKDVLANTEAKMKSPNYIQDPDQAKLELEAFISKQSDFLIQIQQEVEYFNGGLTALENYKSCVDKRTIKTLVNLKEANHAVKQLGLTIEL